jgi:hypothetical protein
MKRSKSVESTIGQDLFASSSGAFFSQGRPNLLGQMRGTVKASAGNVGDFAIKPQAQPNATQL